MILLTFAMSCDVPVEDETYNRPVGEGPWILVDLWHTRIQNPEDYRLEKGVYAYQGVYGFWRLFDQLETSGYNWHSIRTMPLSAPRLEGFDILFINLVHDARPDFTAEEIKVIQEFVHGGGGLFVIADHTNVYRHAERVNPILEPMGIEIAYTTAVDFPPQHSVAGKGWIMIWDFDDHPVTDGVDMISFQTGGSFYTDHGVAFTSTDSFGDFWDEEQEAGYYGNWTWDGDEDIEPLGPLPVVAAAEYGQGRVVVVGDQNIFGDAWINFGNNFEIALNGFEWLAKKESDPRRLRSARRRGTNIGLESSGNFFNTGRTAHDGYYVTFGHFHRDLEITAHATTALTTNHDVHGFLAPTDRYSDSDVDTIRRELEGGKKVFLTFEADQISGATAHLLNALAPDFSLEVDGVTFADKDVLGEVPTRRLTGPSAITSEAMDVDGISLASVALPRGQEERLRYLLDVRSDWGEPLVHSQRGDKYVDIARRKVVGEGELIIFIQDGFWRGRTMGSKETERPTDLNKDAIEFLYRFLDYLKN
ncbi:MAG: hypothetical protein ACNA8W_04570 [Bradymonadaceae bacterium]